MLHSSSQLKKVQPVSWDIWNQVKKKKRQKYFLKSAKCHLLHVTKPWSHFCVALMVGGLQKTSVCYKVSWLPVLVVGFLILHRGGPHPDGEYRFTPGIHSFFWDPSVSTVAPAVIPKGLCVFPGRRGVPLCSSSSSSAWSCRASLDTAQAGAGRSARRTARWAPWPNTVRLVFVNNTHLSFLVPEELAGVFYHLLVRELRVWLLLAEVKYLPQGHPVSPHVTGSGELALCDENNNERTLVPTNQSYPLPLTYQQDALPWHPAYGQNGPPLDSIVVAAVQISAHAEVSNFYSEVFAHQTIPCGQVSMDKV